jgi:methionyl-tRNA formyltransferase
VPSTARDALIAIAALLAPGNQDVADRVVHAHTDPDAYLRDHADRLDDRGIDEPTEDLAWIAMVDALTDHGLLAEVDWKEDPTEILSQLRALNPNPGTWAWVATANTDLATYDFLEQTGTNLQTTGTALAVLDIESDCYPLVLLPTDHTRELVALAETAGFTAAILATATK